MSNLFGKTQAKQTRSRRGVSFRDRLKAEGFTSEQINRLLRVAAVSDLPPKEFVSKAVKARSEQVTFEKRINYGR